MAGGGTQRVGRKEFQKGRRKLLGVICSLWIVGLVSHVCHNIKFYLLNMSLYVN